MTKCATCGGDGELYTSHRFDCPDCNGTGNAPDAAQQDPLLLEVLNFISRCQSLEVRTGGSEVVNKAIEREDLRAQANALYSKLDAVKWGVNTAQLPPDAAQQDPLLLEVLNFISRCQSLEVRTGGSEVVNKAIEREDLRAQANALYSKLDAVKWGVNTAQLPPDVPSREAVEQATKQLRLSCKNMNVDLDWFVSWKTIRARLAWLEKQVEK